MINEFFRKTLCVNRQSSYWSTYVAKTMSDSVTFGRNDVPVPRRYDLKIIVFSRNVLIQSEVCIIILHLASGLDGLPHRYKIKKETMFRAELIMNAGTASTRTGPQNKSFVNYTN